MAFPLSEHGNLQAPTLAASSVSLWVKIDFCSVDLHLVSPFSFLVEIKVDDMRQNLQLFLLQIKGFANLSLHNHAKRSSA
jgi:hypothetical protein